MASKAALAILEKALIHDEEGKLTDDDCPRVIADIVAAEEAERPVRAWFCTGQECTYLTLDVHEHEPMCGEKDLVALIERREP